MTRMSVARRRVLAAGTLLALGGCAGSLRHASGASAWAIEAESPDSRISFAGGEIDIEAPKGLTLWYRQPLTGPVVITFEAMAVARGGANDHVSDLNAFWMATDPGVAGGSVLERPRSGVFEEYDTLRTYYVGIGGNRNTTTRMRRYVGVAGNRPLRPEHDRLGQGDMLVPNRWTRISLIANGADIAVERDGRRVFTLDDPAPYRRGWFAIRTTKSHLRIRHVNFSARQPH